MTIERYTDKNGCYAIREYKCKPSRNNQQTWRLAKWLSVNLTGRRTYEKDKNYLYDKAKELTYMYVRNAFTGPDNHDD